LPFFRAFPCRRLLAGSGRPGKGLDQDRGGGHDAVTSEVKTMTANPACKDCRHCVPLSPVRAHCTCHLRPRGYLTPETPACRQFAPASFPLWRDRWWRKRIGLEAR